MSRFLLLRFLVLLYALVSRLLVYLMGPIDSIRFRIYSKDPFWVVRSMLVLIFGGFTIS